MKQAMDGFVLDVGRETCAVCGRLVEFAENQYSKACSCGNVITLPPFRVKRGKPAEEQAPECFLCRDSGIVFYQAQYNGRLYDYAARCRCRAGQEHPDTGIPRIDHVPNVADVRFLEMQARDKWRREHGSRAAG